MACAALALTLIACSSEKKEESTPAPAETTTEKETETEAETTGKKEMHLYINGEEIPVTWEDNAAVSEMMEAVSVSDIEIAMEKYGGFEQVGSLGRSFTSNDERITTVCGDIMLYNDSNIVLFYGSNTWEYTRLGVINLPEDEIENLLSNDAVELLLKVN